MAPLRRVNKYKQGRSDSAAVLLAKRAAAAATAAAAAAAVPDKDETLALKSKVRDLEEKMEQLKQDHTVAIALALSNALKGAADEKLNRYKFGLRDSAT